VNPISFANWIGSINILLITLLPILHKRAEKLTAMALVALYSATMLVTNSRGPMLSFVLSLIILFLYHFRALHFVKIISRILLGIFFALLLFLLLPEQVTSRYVDLFGGGSDVVSQTHSAYTINTRLFAWKAALSAALSSPLHLLFGIGVGGFSSLFYGMDVRLYPHNMVIEVFCELGLVGLFLLLWHFYAVFAVIVKKLKDLDQQNRILLLSLVMGTVYLLLAALFSGDLNDNRRIWFFMGTALAASGILSTNKHN